MLPGLCRALVLLLSAAMACGHARAGTILTLAVEAEQDRAVSHAPASSRSELAGSVKALFDDGHRLRIAGEVRAIRDREAPERDRIYAGELGAQVSFHAFEVHAGRQMIRWGRLDALRAIDPFRLRDCSNPLEERDEGIWAAGATAYAGRFTIEALWVPFFQSDRIPYGPENAWGFFPRRITGEGGHLVPAAFERGRVRAPRGGIESSEAGVRVDARAAEYDIGLSLARAGERIPSSFAVARYALEPDGVLRVVLDPVHEVFWMAGIDGARPAGSGTVRAEAGIFASEGRREGDDGRDTYTRAGIGADRSFAGLLPRRSIDVFLTYAFDGAAGLQSAGKASDSADVTSVPASASTITTAPFRHPFRHAVAARARVAASSTLLIEAETLRDLQDSDRSFSCLARWSPASGWEIEGELRWVGGPADGFLGRFEGNDAVRVRARYAWSTSLWR